MTKKILAVFAHPDDEAFGPGGTLAKYGHSEVEIHLLCATRGEAGDWDNTHKKSIEKKNSRETKLHNVREKELLKSAKVLGIKKVEFLNFVDGQLSNSLYHKLADKIINKINEFKPQVILTNERLGVSGHLDHIAVSMITTYAFINSKVASKLYYYCITKELRDRRLDDYFIYFPEGYLKEETTTRIDVHKFWEVKKKAMECHKSQINDVRKILKRSENFPKIEYFILQHFFKAHPAFPESDFFAGIK